MNKMRDILLRINEGATFDALRKELGMRKSTTKAMVESMVHTGYVEEIQCETGCGMCPMKCNSLPSNTGIKMYAVTDKGIEYIKAA